MGKRRTNRVNWLPTFGQTITGNEHSAGWHYQMVVAGNVPGFTIAGTALTFDEPRDDDAATPATTSLADFIGSGYLLRRIVGKFHCETQLRGFEDGIPIGVNAVRVGLGFFVAREADQLPGIPIGNLEDYNPLETDNMREPWIWRRTWILANASAKIRNEYQASLGNDPYTSGAYFQFPTSTAGYASVMDGPHLDAKTSRLINDDNRLWAVAAAHPLPIGSQADGEDVILNWILDYRLLGSIVSGGGRQRGVF